VAIRAGSVDTVAAVCLVTGSPPRLGRTRLVCIDGRAGGGKTEFAGALSSDLARHFDQVGVLQMDDVYEGWNGLATAAERLHRELVEPLAAGQPARLRTWDWHRDRWGGVRVVPPPQVLILDGVGSYSKRYDHCVSVLVWVTAPEDLRRARALARDGDAFATRWDAWAAEEELVHGREGTPGRADLVVRTDGGTPDA